MSDTRVAVDLLYLTGKRGGTETYARQLLPRMAALLPEVELVGLTNTLGREAVERWFPGPLHTLRLSGDNRPVWAAAETFVVDRLAARGGADLMWCPANFGPRARRTPTLVTVHDVIAWDFPNPEVSRVTQAVTSGIIGRAARSATRLLTGSEDARDAITRVLGVPASRITVVPHGSADPRPGVDVAAEMAGLGLADGRPTVLSTGNRMPHKNYDGLLRALALIPAERRPRLVVTGSHGEDPLAPVVAELGLEADVVLLGWVTADQLEALYQSATLYACPSLAEGFGLPVIDAMKRGTPVLVADIGALREVGGDAARYASPTDPAAMAAGIEALLADPAERDRLRQAGLARSAQFTWDRSAELTADAVRRTLEDVAAARR
ncbi:glycosyltransferase family 4 protein [Cellulomonas sp. ACRRI]|uniref:glycosyltransferase family 4 protein n=1 Tax=Cellulomonas sp. ACRRI TaxID=2918188 RepID=UPI001EF30E79|nr:glycosyltransferase family 1 protein [Cellulomonas sp. ACRRI]MCG7285416.1 glycosyltransferase family 4 protein [Cellulomonas sp. ACRRI]